MRFACVVVAVVVCAPAVYDRWVAAREGHPRPALPHKPYPVERQVRHRLVHDIEALGYSHEESGQRTAILRRRQGPRCLGAQ
jgi:hypothetical protein